MNVVKVKPQSRKNCEVNSGEPDVGEESVAMGGMPLRIVLRDSGYVIRDSNGDSEDSFFGRVFLTLVLSVDEARKTTYC